MLRLLTHRVVSSAAAIFGASIISFVLLRLLPADPARLVVGRLATEEAHLAMVERMGLNDPLPLQYWNFITGFFQGDWGFSYGVGADVIDLMAARLPASIELGLYAFVFAFVAAVPAALFATYRSNPTADAAVRGISSLGLGIPPFWLALVALIVFSEALGVLPGPGRQLSMDTVAPPRVTGLVTFDALIAGQFLTFLDAVTHLILPVISLGLAPFAFLVRLLRANLLDVAREPFITVVHSKGVGAWLAFWRHALPNAFLPTLTAGGLILAQLLGGSVLVEKVFNWPGIGALVVDSILRQDYAVVQAFIMLSAFAYVAASLVVDILSGLIDPRVRAG